MKILRKCVPDIDQLRIGEKMIAGEGVEILLLPRYLTKQNLEGSYAVISQYLAETPDKCFGLETADISYNSYPYFEETFILNPISRDESVRAKSQKCLLEIARKFIPPFKERDKEIYIQFQATGDAYDPNYKPSEDDRKEMGKELSKFVKTLRDSVGINVMMENQNRIGLSGYHPEKIIYNTVFGTRLSDCNYIDFPLVYDVAHHALDLYTVGEGILYPDGVVTEKGKFFVDVSEEEKHFGRPLASLIKAGDRNDIREFVTDIMIEQMTKYREKIGGVHLSNAGFVGVKIEIEEGLPTLFGGTINLERVLHEIKKINPQFIVPEVMERDYSNPVNQQFFANEIRRIIK